VLLRVIRVFRVHLSPQQDKASVADFSIQRGWWQSYPVTRSFQVGVAILFVGDVVESMENRVEIAHKAIKNGAATRTLARQAHDFM
jgi:hypothetical protein